MRSFLLLLACLTCSQAKYVDLTYAMNKDVVMWPGRTSTFHTETQKELPDGSWLISKGFCISEHTGTHMDAPFHFFKGGASMGKIPLEILVDVPGICIDIYDKVQTVKGGEEKINPNYAITKQDILDWEEKNGEIPPNAVVFVRTGWDKRWPNVYDVLGIPMEQRNKTDAPTQEGKTVTLESEMLKHMNFPGFDRSAAYFLATERVVSGVGIDTMSIDPGNSKTSPAHKMFAKAGIYMIENVANLHLVPSCGFQVFAAPLKVDGGTGAPVRLFAKIP